MQVPISAPKCIQRVPCGAQGVPALLSWPAGIPGDGYLMLLSPGAAGAHFAGKSILQELSLLLLWVPGKEPGSSSIRKASAQLQARGLGGFPGQLFTSAQFLREISGLDVGRWPRKSSRGGAGRRGSGASACAGSGAAPGAPCGQQYQSSVSFLGLFSFLVFLQTRRFLHHPE